MSGATPLYYRVRRSLSSVGRVLLRWASGSQVLSGPFTGLRYGVAAGGSVYPAKILGTYELELLPVVKRWPESHFTRAIDVGAAEGYYAVGLARWLNIPVTAFELEPESRALLTEMAALNGVAAKIEVLGAADTDGLSRCLVETSRQPQLLICDVEGFELDLLDPVKVPALRDTWILAETHDCYRAGCTEELLRRFGPTHQIEQIKTRPRTLADYPPVSGTLRYLPGVLKTRFMSERRPAAMDWLWMTPKANRDSTLRTQASASTSAS